MAESLVPVFAVTSARELSRFIAWTLSVLTVCGAVVSARVLERGKQATPDERLPYQQVMGALPVADQRRFVELREGIFEIENLRGSSGRWPEVEELREQALPPFFSSLEGSETLRWEKREQGSYVNYLGILDGAGGTTRWLILFIEPPKGLLKAPGEPPPPVDEEHHTLSDGTALHVTVWVSSAENKGPETVLPTPALEGWTQVLGR